MHADGNEMRVFGERQSISADLSSAAEKPESRQSFA
jgi:hypothetical protein